MDADAQVEMASRSSPSGRTEAGSLATVPRGYDTHSARRPPAPAGSFVHEEMTLAKGAVSARVTLSRQRRPPPPYGEAALPTSRRAGASSREDWRRQRERERERRVSDADASQYGHVNRASDPHSAVSTVKHSNNNPLSKTRPGPLPKAPVKPGLNRSRRPTHTWPYVSAALLSANRNTLYIPGPRCQVTRGCLLNESTAQGRLRGDPFVSTVAQFNRVGPHTSVAYGDGRVLRARRCARSRLVSCGWTARRSLRAGSGTRARWRDRAPARRRSSRTTRSPATRARKSSCGRPWPSPDAAVRGPADPRCHSPASPTQRARFHLARTSARSAPGHQHRSRLALSDRELTIKRLLAVAAEPVLAVGAHVFDQWQQCLSLLG